MKRQDPRDTDLRVTRGTGNVFADLGLHIPRSAWPRRNSPAPLRV